MGVDFSFSSQRRCYAASGGKQSLSEPLAGLKISPRASRSFQDVHVCVGGEQGEVWMDRSCFLEAQIYILIVIANSNCTICTV